MRKRILIDSSEHFIVYVKVKATTGKEIHVSGDIRFHNSTSYCAKYLQVLREHFLNHGVDGSIGPEPVLPIWHDLTHAPAQSAFFGRKHFRRLIEV